MKIGSVSGASPAVPKNPAGHTGRSFVEVLRAADHEARAPGATSPAPAGVKAVAALPQKPTAPKEASSPLTRALDNVNKGEARLDALLEAAAKGKTFSAGELLAMQASVFKVSQTVEVLSRATDKLVGALKQTLGTQV